MEPLLVVTTAVRGTLLTASGEGVPFREVPFDRLHQEMRIQRRYKRAHFGSKLENTNTEKMGYFM